MAGSFVNVRWSNEFMSKLDEIKRELAGKLTEALERAEAAEARIRGAEFWTNYSYPGGATPEEIQNELLDYHQYLEETAKVYDHITGGLVSKQNTMAFEVISIYDEKVIGLEDRAEKAEERAEKAETEISSLLAVIDKAVDCYFNDKGNIKDAMYALRGKVEPK